MIRAFAVALLALAFVPLSTSIARAESWCAYPLWAHEWGVQSFDGQGVPVAATLPPWFHRSANGASGRTPVRDMPVDGGERSLPVLHFYSNGTLSPNSIPVGIEVGFRRGAATVWYPQVQGIRSATEANSPTAFAARQRLIEARAARTPMGGPYATLDRDPTRQLFWDRLELSAQPTNSAHPSTQPWINTARGFDALWVNGAQESERFVFYEGATRERPLVSLERGSRHSASRRHIVLHNRSAYPVHDAILTHRQSGRVYVAHIPRIPAGRRAGFILEEHLIGAADVEARTRGLIRERLVDAGASTPATSQGECPMMRDPAIPVESAVSHRLYAAEVELILQTWGAAFFDAPGTTLVYREDTAYLDAMLPLSLYTDMYNDIVLHRASLAVQRGIALP